MLVSQRLPPALAVGEEPGHNESGLDGGFMHEMADEGYGTSGGGGGLLHADSLSHAGEARGGRYHTDWPICSGGGDGREITHRRAA